MENRRSRESLSKPAHLTLRTVVAHTAFLVWSIAWLLPLAPAWAYEGRSIRVQANTYDFTFGQQVRFQLKVESDDPIQSIVLAYRTLDTLGTTVETMDFDAGTSVQIEYIHEIQHRYIRPFVELTYWWTIVNAAGDRLITEPQSFEYTDNRFPWQMLSGEVIRIHWYQGDLKIAQQALDVAAAGVNRARQDIEVEAIRKEIDVYLYADIDDMRAALPSALPSGVEALTLYETSVILVPFAPEGANIPHLRRVLPHEVTHALLHEATQSDFDRVPLWFSEGLATSVQHTFAPDPDVRSLLNEAIQEHDLIPLHTLCASFPSDLARARLAYAESASVIDFVRDTYGRQALRDLVDAYADGATCEGGVQRVLKKSTDRLQSQWRESLAPRSAWAIFWDENGAWVVLSILVAGFPLLFILPPRKGS